MGLRRPIGHSGDWFAVLGMERIPCIHAHYVQKGSMKYLDPGYQDGLGKWPRFISVLASSRRAILTTDEVTSDPRDKSGLGFRRTGYIALFEVSQPIIIEGQLHLDLINRLEDLR